jgi:metabolite-proton symporter
MERAGGEERGRASSIRRVALASFVGTTIEWYDFFIYGTAAALVFPALFFPEQTPLVGTLLAFATFGVGFLARPLGGAVFGHFGDRVGRKSMLVLTLILMGTATFLIGLLPTYQQIGVLAPILLVVLRLLQGLGLGGEWGGAALMAVEHSPRGRRGFYGSFPQMGVPAGILLSNTVFLLLAASLSEEQFASWGWRVPFLLSIVLVGVGLFIRLKIMESPAFRRVRETRTEARMPIVDVFRTYPGQIALAAGAFVAASGVGYITLAYLLAYATEVLGLSRSSILSVVLLASAIQIPALAFFAARSDRVGRRMVFSGGAALGALWAFPYFWLVDTGSIVLIFVAITVMATAISAMSGPQAALFAEMFGTRVRYSGASLGYQLGAIFGGGFAPFIAASLYAATTSSLSISAYMLALCIVSLVSVLLITETYQKDIEEVEPEEREVVAEAPEARDPAVG